ncbi:MAG: hypothetical protein WAN36_01870 [Calditrichia bacterium]
MNSKTVKDFQSVKLHIKDSQAINGIVLQNRNGYLYFVPEKTHELDSVRIESVVRIEPLEQQYDFRAYPISEAETNKYKTNHSTYGYAVGGAVLGAAAGLVAGLPFWYAEVGGVPPYLTAGAGAIVGSIYFAIRGQEKDRQRSIQYIRVLRQEEIDLENELVLEKEKIKKLQEQKEMLNEQLKSRQNNTSSENE